MSPPPLTSRSVTAVSNARIVGLVAVLVAAALLPVATIQSALQPGLASAVGFVTRAAAQSLAVGLLARADAAN